MPRIQGVYQIRNTLTGDTYIGSSIHIARRRTNHRWALAMAAKKYIGTRTRCCKRLGTMTESTGSRFSHWNW